MSHTWFAIPLVVNIIVLASLHTAMTAEPAIEKLGITDKEQAMLVESANKKARELGFNPERSNFRLTKEKDLFKADFSPKEKKGEIIYGGNLTLYLDRKGRILRVEASP
jgi:hypothetical protein